MTGPAAARSDERGSGTFLMAGVLTVVLMFAGVAMVIAGYLVAAHRARAGADLAAVSGATAFAQEGDACAEATTIARSNHTRPLRCEVSGDEIDFVVSVAVAADVGMRVPGLPWRVEAIAYAGPVTS